MSIYDANLYSTLYSEIEFHIANTRNLPGIDSPAKKDTLIRQIIDSIHRVSYITRITQRGVGENRVNPNSEFFDPLKAAIHFRQIGNIDEAFWLTFLSIHFGKSAASGWRLTRDIYGALGESPHWTWSRTSRNINEFENWLVEKYETLTGDGVIRQFSNHRKYETLRNNPISGTAAVIRSYIDWVGMPHSHQHLINSAIAVVGNTPHALFHYLYSTMHSVKRFGRLAKFDYLTMVAKLGLAEIEPGIAYLQDSTGPLQGARLLFGGNGNAPISATTLEAYISELNAGLSIGYMSMQILEDSLCNWQKNPERYVNFTG